MVKVYKSSIKQFGHELFIACIIKMHDDGTNLENKLIVRPQKGGITNEVFIRFCHCELTRFKMHHVYSCQSIESTYNVKFCRVRLRSKTNLTFIDKPIWGDNIIYITEQTR